MTYLQLCLALGLVVLLFVAALILVRRRFPGDYTPLKVIVGVGLVEAARWFHGAQAGANDVYLWQSFGLMALAGCLICLWQLGEWWIRRDERLTRRLKKLEERLERSHPAARGSGGA